MGRLRSLRQRYLDAALAPTTMATYNTGILQYKRFCAGLKVTTFPLTAATLELFVTALAQRVGYKTIKVYLSGLQFHSALAGWPVRVAQMTTLNYVLRGIRRVQGPSFTRRPRAPILVAHLQRFFLRGAVLSPPSILLCLRLHLPLPFLVSLGFRNLHPHGWVCGTPPFI